MEIDFDGMFDGNGNDCDADRHPLNVFCGLVAEEPDNAVYRACLRNEIEDMVSNLTSSIDDYHLLMLKTFTDMAPSEEQMMRINADPVDRIRIMSFREIVNRVFDIRLLKNGGSEEESEEV